MPPCRGICWRQIFSFFPESHLAVIFRFLYTRLVGGLLPPKPRLDFRRDRAPPALLELSLTVWSLPAAKFAIVVAGCLAMVYTQLTMSPATIEYARSFGATGLHIGILGAIPTGMLFMQFLAALAANRLKYRRRVWFWVTLVQRLLFLPMALGAWLMPDVANQVWLWLLMGITALNHGLIHFSTPLWLSWMGDYLPHRGLNHYWGRRHSWMQVAAAVSLFGGALFMLEDDSGIRSSFGVLLVVGAVFGVADILLFAKVDEPPVTPAPSPRLRDVLSAPFRHADFRCFIGFTCYWHVAAMVAAPFISYYLLAYVGMDVYHVMLLWTCSWIGGAMFSTRLGRLAEVYGNRPVLVICTAFKSLNVLALLLTPQDPQLAFWILIPAFMIDAALNAGIAIANNGFLIKNSPTENRAMFIAAGTAVAGMVGGVTSILAGVFMTLTSHTTWMVGGLSLTNFHVLFSVSLVLRLLAAVLARRVREPSSEGVRVVMAELVGVTPIRILRFPLEMYRTFRRPEPELPGLDVSLHCPAPAPHVVAAMSDELRSGVELQPAPALAAASQPETVASRAA